MSPAVVAAGPEAARSAELPGQPPAGQKPSCTASTVRPFSVEIVSFFSTRSSESSNNSSYFGVGFRFRRESVHAPHLAEHCPVGQRKTHRQYPRSGLAYLVRMQDE